MSPASKRSDLLAGAVAGVLSLICGPGCGTATASTAVAVVGIDGAPGGAAPERLPDAVAAERRSALPSPARRADAKGIISLRESAAVRATVAALVEAFADAWEHESIDMLQALLTVDAGPLDVRGRAAGGGRAALVEAWRQRLHAHPYGRLAGVELIRPELIERYDREELGGPDAPALPADMLPGEIYVRAPIEVTRVGGERVFGDAVEMLLRRSEGKLLIAAYSEPGAP